MGYFRELPDVQYQSFLSDAISSQDYLRVKNLFRRNKLRDDLQNVFTIFNKYEIPEGARPDTVAEEFYGSATLDWVVLMTAGIINVRDEWPLSNYQLYKYAENKYGIAGLNDIHHYETKEVKDSNGRLILPAGKVVDKDFSFHYTDIDTSINNTFGQLQSINVNNGGSGFLDGTYPDIQVTTGGIGIGATFTVTVSGGKIEKESIIVTTPGKNYDLGNSISFIGIGTTAGTDTETEILVNKRFTNTRGVTNWEYETIKNDKKSSIYLLKQGYLQQFLNDMREIMIYGISSEYVNESLIRTENTKVTTSY